MLRNIRIGLGLLLLAGSIVFLAWGYWPSRRELRLQPVSAPASSQAAEDALTLLFPPRIRVGEAGVVRATLDVGALKDFLPIARGTISSNFYETHNVIVEARFDLPGVSVQPSELISAPVSPGQTAVFYWTLRPGDAGKFRGTIWLYLRTVDKQTGEERRETVSAQIVDITAVKLLGLTINRVRIIGLVGFGIGLFLFLPILEARVPGFLQKIGLISK